MDEMEPRRHHGASNRQDKLQVLWWRLGHRSTKAVFSNFASGDLVGKITYKFAKMSRNFKNIGKLLSSTEIH